MRLQAEADGKYWAAEVVAVSQKRKDAPVKVTFIGYDKQYDEWLGAERLRSKVIVPMSKERTVRRRPTPSWDGGKAAFGAVMPPAARKLLLTKPKVKAPLDPGFSPLILAKQKYMEAAKDGVFCNGFRLCLLVADCKDKLTWALVRSDGCGRYSLPVFPEGTKDARASAYLAGILIQEMIWQRSASSMVLHGPAKICKYLQKCYSTGGAYEFEVMSMPKVCGHPETPFEVKVVENESEIPENKDTPQADPAFTTRHVCGKDANGCRLAFDLGKSDIKTVAVKDNEVVYSKETEWDVTNPDPQYHFDAILAALKLAKDTLPKVEAIGGSATGTVSALNEATWCDIFPNETWSARRRETCLATAQVPPDVYKEKVVDIFIRLGKEIAGDVPLKVINDGEVTALAAVQKIKAGNVMGISMGSSEGYANADGNLMGWISELCYCKIDLNPKAPTDPWSKGAHRGLSHMYLGQRGTTKLASKGGVEVPANYKYPHAAARQNGVHWPSAITHSSARCWGGSFHLCQEAMKGDKAEEVKKIYETVGVYLGYALAGYCEFYKIDHVMILGRVSKGKGGDIMLDMAKKVLEEDTLLSSRGGGAVHRCGGLARAEEMKVQALSYEFAMGTWPSRPDLSLRI
eukprot:g4430.t1